MTNRPVILNDPTGHCPGRKPGQKCASNPKITGPLPDWWGGQQHIYIEGYGYFDTGHIKRGWESAKYFEEQTDLALAKGGGMFPALSKGRLGDIFSATYSVSNKVNQDQMAEVMYGMYTNFEYSYEEYQGKRYDAISSFTPEDLPSDHIGFWAYTHGIKKYEIPALLVRLGEVSHVSPISMRNPFVYQENHKFLPMDFRGVSTVRGPGVRLVNVPWPSWLEVDRISSGPDTWQRVK